MLILVLTALPLVQATEMSPFSMDRQGLVEDWSLARMITQDALGKAVYHAMPMAREFTNPWPAALEAEFQTRAHTIIAAQSAMKVAAGNTYFENENVRMAI